MLKNLKNNIKMILIFKGVLIIIILKLLSDYVFKLTTLGYLLEYVKMWGPLALIIIFQPEIRNILEQLGRKQIITNHRTLTMDEREKVVYEITNAVDYLRKARMGGLIVIEREISLNQYIERSKNLYADISSELLISIFFPRNPLHDGGVIIQGDKIACAGAVFPTSNSSKVNKKFGTRHRAALGIVEESLQGTTDTANNTDLSNLVDQFEEGAESAGNFEDAIKELQDSFSGFQDGIDLLSQMIEEFQQYGVYAPYILKEYRKPF